MTELKKKNGGKNFKWLNLLYNCKHLFEISEKKLRKAEEKESSTRHKRQASYINLQVELEMVIDYSIYNL